MSWNCIISGDFSLSWKNWGKQNEYASVNKSAFIKDWAVAVLRAWQRWQWVTPFRRGFALCSIISHYYMSHLLPRIPMGRETHRHTHTDTHTHTHTHTHTYTHSHIQTKPGVQHIAPINPETQRHTLALGQEGSHSRQPSTSSTTRQLLKRKNHLNDNDETACHTAKQKSLGAWGDTLHPLWHYKTVGHEPRPRGAMS